MGRPPKSTKMLSNRLSKAEKQKRIDKENQMKGASDKVEPSKHLNASQKRIFKSVVEELKASGILGNLDVYILDLFAIAVDRLREIEKLINQDFSKLYDKDLMASKNKYTQDMMRAIQELSLSPSARAKIGALNLKQKEDDSDPLLTLLKGGKE